MSNRLPRRSFDTRLQRWKRLRKAVDSALVDLHEASLQILEMNYAHGKSYSDEVIARYEDARQYLDHAEPQLQRLRNACYAQRRCP